jgi:hypothetical protein
MICRIKVMKRYNGQTDLNNSPNYLEDATGVYGTDQSLSDVHDKLLQGTKRSHRSPYWSEAPLTMKQLMPIHTLAFRSIRRMDRVSQVYFIKSYKDQTTILPKDDQTIYNESTSFQSIRI